MFTGPISESEVLFHIKLPVDKHRTKKNGKRAFYDKKSGRAWVTSKSGVKEQENDIAQAFFLARKHPTIDIEIHAEFRFTFKDFFTAKGVRRKNLPDLSNLIELPQDALQKAGVIQNDSLISSLDGSRRIAGDENTLEVTLWAYLAT